MKSKVSTEDKYQENKEEFFLPYYNILYPSLMCIIFYYMFSNGLKSDFEFYAHFFAFLSMLYVCIMSPLLLIYVIKFGKNGNKNKRYYFISIIESLPTLVVNIVFVFWNWNIIGSAGLLFWLLQLFCIYRKNEINVD